MRQNHPRLDARTSRQRASMGRTPQHKSNNSHVTDTGPSAAGRLTEEEAPGAEPFAHTTITTTTAVMTEFWLELYLHKMTSEKVADSRHGCDSFYRERRWSRNQLGSLGNTEWLLFISSSSRTSCESSSSEFL